MQTKCFALAEVPVQNVRTMTKNNGKKPAGKKISKNRQICVSLPISLLESAKTYRRRAGFNSMSELLRAATERAEKIASLNRAVEKRTQISFRLPDALYTRIFRLSGSTGQSTAKIIRTLLENAQKFGIRPAGMPETKKRAVPAKPAPKTKKTAPAKKSVTSAKKTAKKSTKKRG